MTTMSSEKKTGNTPTTRKEITSHITSSLGLYFIPKLYSLYFEVGIEKRGRRRADVIAVNMKREVIICEVKSGWQDFAADHKWESYLDFCNKMYFAVTHSFWESHGPKIRERLIGSGCGVICIQSNGQVCVVLPARRRIIPYENRSWFFSKLIWIGGLSRAKRKNS